MSYRDPDSGLDFPSYEEYERQRGGFYDHQDEEEDDRPNCPGMGMDDLCAWPDVDGCGLCTSRVQP